ncbi:MAG: methylated-DNA--[protein]-cysteine S-methyltransferase [Bifidobacteriaceae bacterium]|jgi:methylated-DNA-[protein]-cysteine S-methyltransferase|nr:methylated-DNA--[protein]-cysteine S-methyltransferase [Bifidobacteriaceae bacterium]
MAGVIARVPGRGAPEVSLAQATIDTPIGRLGLLATEKGLVRVAFEGEPLELALSQAAARLGAVAVDRPARLDPAKRQLDQYFGRDRRVFDLKLDLRLVRGFTLAVVKHLNTLPYGRTVSYGQVAQAVGRPGAARAVGQACGANPVPVVVPCHRIIRAGGSLGGFGGGLDVKTALLALEGVLT